MATDALVLVPQGGFMERPEQIIARIKQARETVIAIQKEIMKPGVHYGIIPGTDAIALLKEGADVLNMAFQLSPREEEVLDLSAHDDERKYKATVGLYSADGRRLGFGVGICSTSEEKYKWRRAYRQEWDQTPADRRREHSGEKNGEKYQILQVRTDPANMENTVLQMAVKRGLVQATRQVHAVSDIFADITALDLSEEELESLKIGSRRKVATPRAKSKPQETGQPSARPKPPTKTEDADTATERVGLDANIPDEAWVEAKRSFHDKGFISDRQQARLFAIANAKGWRFDDVGVLLAEHLGIDSREVDGKKVFNLPHGTPYDKVVAIFQEFGPAS